MTNIENFKINIAPEILTDLKARLARTRFPDEIENSDWDYGTNLDYLKELCAYWQNDFDWREWEEKLNSFAQFTTEIDNTKIHFIHEKGKGKKRIPLLLTHGFPDSIFRFYKLIPLLTEDRNGVSFDVVVPSIPGYGFSEKPIGKRFRR